jgi:methyl-accepting chemotaxis protein
MKQIHQPAISNSSFPQSKQTQKISTININNVQQNVASGMNLTLETKEQFNEIVSYVEQVTSHQIQEVAAATQQLTAGVEVIQHTISTLDTGTKETASRSDAGALATAEQLGSMEKISSAAVSLSHLAEELQMVVSRFKY